MAANINHALLGPTGSNAYLHRDRDGCLHLNWQLLIAAVKAIIVCHTHSEIDNTSRSTIKSWLKSDQCSVALMGCTFIHTLSLNAGGPLRQQLATSKWMDRLEKILEKPQHPLVGEAVRQVLLDWRHIFRQDILGMRADRTLSKNKKAIEGVNTSRVAVEALEEMSLGLPVVGPRRGLDFLHLASVAGAFSPTTNTLNTGPFTRTNSTSSTSSNITDRAASSSILDRPSTSSSTADRTLSGSHHGSALGSRPLDNDMIEVLSKLTLNPAPLRVSPSMVPSLLSKMQADIAELRRRTAAACSVSQPSTGASPARAVPRHLAKCVEEGYIAAERCSEWRFRVTELTHTMQDPASLASLLHEVDQANGALQGWQTYASGGMLFQALGLPSDAASRWRSQLKQQLHHHHQHYQQQQQQERRQHQQQGCTGYQEALLVDLDDLIQPEASLSSRVHVGVNNHRPAPIPPAPPLSSTNNNPFASDALSNPSPSALPSPSTTSQPSLPSPSTSQPPCMPPAIQTNPFNPFAALENSSNPSTAQPQPKPPSNPTALAADWATFSPAKAPLMHQTSEPLNPDSRAIVAVGSASTSSLPNYNPLNNSVPTNSQPFNSVPVSGLSTLTDGLPTSSNGHSASSAFASNTGGGISMQQQRALTQLQQQQQEQQRAVIAAAKRPASLVQTSSTSILAPPLSPDALSPSQQLQQSQPLPRPSSSGTPLDWQAEFAQLLSALQRPLVAGGPPQVQAAAAQQMTVFFRRMQAHYEGQISSTKAHSLNVLKQMQKEHQQQQQQQSPRQ